MPPSARRCLIAPRRWASRSPLSCRKQGKVQGMPRGSDCGHGLPDRAYARGNTSPRKFPVVVPLSHREGFGPVIRCHTLRRGAMARSNAMCVRTAFRRAHEKARPRGHAGRRSRSARRRRDRALDGTDPRHRHGSRHHNDRRAVAESRNGRSRGRRFAGKSAALRWVGCDVADFLRHA